MNLQPGLCFYPKFTKLLFNKEKHHQTGESHSSGDLEKNHKKPPLVCFFNIGCVIKQITSVYTCAPPHKYIIKYNIYGVAGQRNICCFCHQVPHIFGSGVAIAIQTLFPAIWGSKEVNETLKAPPRDRRTAQPDLQPETNGRGSENRQWAEFLPHVFVCKLTPINPAKM